MKLRLLSVPLLCLAASFATAEENAKAPHSDVLLNLPHNVDVNLACRFTIECFDTEGCSDTQFDTSLTGHAGGKTPENMIAIAEFVTDAETLPMVGARDNGALQLAHRTEAAHHMITVATTGDTRYSVHLSDGPMMISYAGICTPE